ncbi:MAG: hypothetical protein M3680_26720 [Myxococcota bacterium]|nr:hypothetical protein [Myxococcota bacterium]
MRAHLLVAGVLATTTTTSAGAAPAADVVVAWSAQPLGVTGIAINGAASRAGASYIDVSPEAVALPDALPLIKRGIAAYGNLELEAAINSLDAAASLIDQTGAAAIDTTMLADLFLYRALAHATRGNDARSWDDLVVVAGIQPTRVLDPAGFGPRAVERFGQARAHVAALPRGKVTLAGGPRCQVRIDGIVVSTPEVELPFSRHWLDASCEGREPVRRRLEVDRVTLEAKLAGRELAMPDDAALLIQARTAAARAILIVIVQPSAAVIRKLGVDGKERDRATVTLRGTERDRGDIAAVVSRLLEPARPRPPEPWYRSRWVWAGAGAVIASAILIPFAVRNGGDVPEVVIRPEGTPPW